jgi:hypothetical protein
MDSYVCAPDAITLSHEPAAFTPTNGARFRIDISIPYAMILLYILARFFYGKAALFLLFIFALCLLPTIGPRGWLNRDFAFQSPLLILLAGAVWRELATGDAIAANYFIFAFMCVWIFATSEKILVCNVRNLYLVVAAYLCVVTPFLLFPQLQAMSSYVPSLKERSWALYSYERTIRPRAFFFHAAEFGNVTCALAMTVLFSRTRSGMTSRHRLVRIALLVLLVTCIVISTCTTAEIMFGAALIIRYVRKRYVGLALTVFLALQFMSQLIYAGDVAKLLSPGSFQWRYMMADDIYNNHSVFLGFDPDKIDTLSNAPHSLLMDMCLCFGRLGAYLFALLLIVYCVCSRTVRRGWNALFYIACCVYPIGASPSYLAVAAACAYASVVPTSHAAHD